jgi:hypothetical protein
MIHLFILNLCLVGATWCATAQNTIVYLIPDASGSDEAKIAFDNSLNHALYLVNQSEHFLLYAEGYLKRYTALTPEDARLVIDSLRASEDGVRLSNEDDQSVRGFQGALDAFEEASGIFLMDESKPNVDLYVLIAGDLEEVVSENMLIEDWFIPVFRQNGWPSPLQSGGSWPEWLLAKHRFDLSNTGKSTSLP